LRLGDSAADQKEEHQRDAMRGSEPQHEKSCRAFGGCGPRKTCGSGQKNRQVGPLR